MSSGSTYMNASGGGGMVNSNSSNSNVIGGVSSSGGSTVTSGVTSTTVGTTAVTSTATTTTTAANNNNNINNTNKPQLLFIIVGINEPLYEAELSNNQNKTSTVADSITRQNYFVLHSALDLADKAAWTTNHMYLKVVDKVNQQEVSTFVTAGNIKFMLLHNGKNDDVIKSFFNDVYEIYVKLLMNPFTQYDAPITSKLFDTRVRAIGRRYLF